jgi:hypothetical protein
MTEIAEGKLSNCGLEVADIRKNCDYGIAELRLRSNIPLKVAELRLRKFFLQVAELRLRTPKEVARAHLWKNPLIFLLPHNFFCGHCIYDKERMNFVYCKYLLYV